MSSSGASIRERLTPGRQRQLDRAVDSYVSNRNSGRSTARAEATIKRLTGRTYRSFVRTT